MYSSGLPGPMLLTSSSSKFETSKSYQDFDVVKMAGDSAPKTSSAPRLPWP